MAATGAARLTVVLADDAPELRAVVARSLHSSGRFEVVGEAGDGDEALDVVIRQVPDVLLIDVSMPSADGLEALPWIAATYPDMAIVVFTGFEDPNLKTRAKELGALDVVEKSIRLDTLPSRLLEILGAPPLEEEPPGPRLSVVGSPAERAENVEGQEVLDQHLLQFRQLFDRAAIGMATMTMRGTVVRANVALAGRMSCQPEDLVGVDYGRLTSGEGDLLDNALEAVLTGRDDLATFEHRVPNGRGGHGGRIARVTLAAIRDGHDRVLYVFAQVQDVTAQRLAEDSLRLSEETFRLLVSAVADYAIYMLDTQGKVVSWNSGAQRIKGYRSDEIVGRSFEEFYPPEDRASGAPRRNLEAALEQGSYSEEGWRVRKDGSRFWASVVVRPVRDESGRHVGFAKVTRDLTEQRASEQQHAELVAQQNQLLAVTAHELRTPMTVIDAAVDILQSGWGDLEDSERDGLLNGIRNSGERVDRLASDLATVARLEGHGLELHREPVTLARLAERAVVRARAFAPRRQISVEVPDDLVVDGDVRRLDQVLDNLVDNAVRHGGDPISVSARRDGDTLCLRVTDGGPGVSEELLPRLFERFATGSRSRGTGLGLFLVREVVRAHGGEATYRAPTASTPSTFELALPSAEPADAPDSSGAEDAGATGSAGHGLRPAADG